VIGIGNEIRHDDGAGPTVVQRLAELNLPGVSLTVTDGEPSRLIELWSEADLVVIVDAVRNDPARPGRIHQLIVDRPVGGSTDIATSHEFRLNRAINLVITLTRLPRRLVILTVEGADFTPGVGLTPNVAASIDRLVQLASCEVTSANEH
jgi:hydrogenase maturation protease